MEQAIVIELSTAGMISQAEALERAQGLQETRRCLEAALQAVDGALTMLTLYERFLAGTGAAAHRGALMALEESMIARLAVLSADAKGESLDAATEWLLAELPDYLPSLGEMRSNALKELKRPRDALHKSWAETFLRETDRYCAER